MMLTHGKKILNIHFTKGFIRVCHSHELPSTDADEGGTVLKVKYTAVI